MAESEQTSPNDPAPMDPVDRELIELARKQVDAVDGEAQATTRISPGGSGPSPPSSGEYDLPRDLLPGYEIIREIHRGGQGVVYLAIHSNTRRKVAIKVMHEGPHAGPAARERFKREIQLIATLEHPNIVKVIDSGINQDRYFYAMDYISGLSLDQYVAQSALSIEKILQTFTRICDAIDFAHKQGIVHRDLKPSNILVDRRGDPHLVDFGLAKVAAGGVGGGDQPVLISITGQVVGTLPYMSPEQARGDMAGVDARTDVYALGVILYQLLTGRFPYEVIGNMRDVLDNILRVEPRRPSTIRRHLHNDLETILLKSLSKEPLRRYQSAAEMARDIAHFLAAEPIEAKRDSGWYVLKKRITPYRRAIAVSGLLVALTVTIILLAKSTLKWKERAESYETQTIGESYAERQQSGDEFVVRPVPANSDECNLESTVTIGLQEFPELLNPFDARPDELIVCDQIFESLVISNANLEWTVNSRLGTLEPSPDEGSVTVNLHPNLYWQDGRSLSIDDVIFSWEMAKSATLGEAWQRMPSYILRWKQEGDLRARCWFDGPMPAVWQPCLAFSLIPKHHYQPLVEMATKTSSASTRENEVESNGEDEAGNSPQLLEALEYPVGSGPYRRVRGEEGAVVLERNEYWSGPRLRIKRLVFRQIKDTSTKFSEFAAGRLDLVSLTLREYSHDWFDSEARYKGEELKSSWATSGIQCILWNCGGGSDLSVSDARVRRAVAQAIDFDKLMRPLTENLGSPWYYPMLAYSEDWDPDLRPFAFDLDAAGKILDDAGWKRTGDGPRRWEGDSTPSSIPDHRMLSIALLVPKESEIASKMAENLKKDLARIGVELRVETKPFGECYQRIVNREFTAAVFAALPPVELDGWRVMFGTGGLSNLGQYSNDQVDALFDQAPLEHDPVIRRDKYRLIYQILHHDQPVTWLFNMPALWAKSHRLQGVRFSRRGPFYFHPSVCDWWVPAKPASTTTPQSH